MVLIWKGRWIMPAIALLCFMAGVCFAGQGPKDKSGSALWSAMDSADLPAIQTHPLVPRLLHFRAYTLSLKTMRSMLAQAPREFSLDVRQSPTVITLPAPDGNLLRFHVVESPILGPALAAERPDIKTYAAQGIDDPTATARLDLTPEGFHAMVLSSLGQIFVDPYQRGDTTHYLIYDKSDMLPGNNNPSCFTDASTMTVNHPRGGFSRDRFVSSGTFLREYRVAISCTGEYGAAAGGTTTAAQDRIITTINRINGVYEKDFTIRITLVATRIYLDGNTDPFSNYNPFDLLSENQAELDNKVGTENYDVGHVFSTGGGGVAYLGVICEPNFKGQGTSGLPNPVGDPFDIDYVAHEMGHQFGADHTFNGSLGACNGNRNPATAYEPGSASTIMGYAGICGSENVQPNSDPYFHVISFDEIIAVRDGSGACVAQIPTGNTAPVVSAGPNYTIPTGTPFTLTATATDADGDVLTYCWEQFDLGTTDSTKPLFRSRNPSTSPSRIFPKLSTILANTNDKWEVLPTVNRTMRFRCTVRDNRAGAGGINYAGMTVTVAGTPFAVTAPNTAVTWAAGSTQTVTWNVGGGSVAPNVRILLSTDGGNNFTPLIETTPNDGSEVVTMPLTGSTQCRIKVEAVGNIFFDVSNANFTLTNPTPALASLSPSQRTAGGSEFTLTVNGSGFVPASVVRWNGSSRATTFVSSTQLNAGIAAEDIVSAGTKSVTVFNPTPGGGASSVQNFTVNANVVSGEVTFDDISSPAQPLTFEFRPTNGGDTITRTQTLTPTGDVRGSFAFADIPPGVYTLAIKGAKWLRTLVPVDTTGMGASDLQAFLPGGDANDDNSVDVLDLDALIQAFDSLEGDPQWNDGADLNCDLSVDVIDLDLIIRSFDRSGEP